MGNMVINPIQFFPDLSGLPLDDGSVFIGLPNTNPMTNPVSVYQDPAMTIPAAQPLKTTQGAFSLNGTPLPVYVAAASYSMAVLNKAGSVVMSLPSVANSIFGNVNFVISSIAQLRTLPHLLYSNAFVTGYYAAHDGGGGPYQYDPNDTSSVDNGGTVIVANDGGRWKLQTIGPVSARQFGAKGDNLNDDTSMLQAWLNWGTSWFLPDGKFCFTALTIPQVTGFCLFGLGPSSKLIQKGSGIKFPSMTTQCFDSHGTIRDLAFDGTNGTGNTLDTSFCQTLDILNTSYNNVPVGFCSLNLNGNPTDGTYAHDVRVKNIRIYSTTAGNAGIALGAQHSDSSIDGFNMNGNFTTNYCLLAVPGAQTTTVSNSHPYNALINVVRLQGNNDYFAWDACTFDNANQDTFYQLASINGRFTNCFFEATAPGQHALVFDNSYNNVVVNASFSMASGIGAACVQEDNGSSGNKVIGGQIDNVASWTSLFSLSGSGSYAKGFQGYASYDSVYSLFGTAQTPQAQNTTLQYGANGSGNLGNTGWMVGLAGAVMFATVYVDITPAPGQTFLFNLQVNGTTITTGTITNGSFGTTFKPSPAYKVNVGDQISIQSIFTATSGSASPRYAVTLNG